MNICKSFLLVFLLVLYSFSLGYYTLYGVFKSYNEYFCRQRRPDSQSYWSEVDGSCLNMSSIPNSPGEYLVVMNGFFRVFGGGREFVSYMNTFDEDKSAYLNRNLTFSSGRKFGLSYDYKDSHFEVSCTPGEDTIFTNNTLRVREKRGKKDLFFAEKPMCLDDKGQVIRCYDIDFENLAFSLNQTLIQFSEIKCNVGVSPFICSTKQSTDDFFYKIYLIFICVFCVFLPFCFLNINDYYFLRMIHKIEGKFEGLRIIEFCNPIHGKPVYMNSGEEIIKVAVDDGSETIISQSESRKLNTFTDMKGFYFIQNNCVHIKIKNRIGYSLFLEDNKIDTIRSYFFEATMNNNLCVVNNSEDHYLCTEEALNLMSMGMTFVKRKKMKSGFILELDAFVFGLLKNAYEVKNETLKFLMKHNEFFFNGLNVDCLKLCLDGKMQYYKRPVNVKNSQWKWYCSDFCTIMKDLHNFDYKSQTKWYPSIALAKARMLDLSELKVDNRSFEIETNQKPPLSRLMNNARFDLEKGPFAVSRAWKPANPINMCITKIKTVAKEKSIKCGYQDRCHDMATVCLGFEESMMILNSEGGFNRSDRKMKEEAKLIREEEKMDVEQKWEKVKSKVLENVNNFKDKLAEYKSVLLEASPVVKDKIELGFKHPPRDLEEESSSVTKPKVTKNKKVRNLYPVVKEISGKVKSQMKLVKEGLFRLDNKFRILGELKEEFHEKDMGKLLKTSVKFTTNQLVEKILSSRASFLKSKEGKKKKRKSKKKKSFVTKKREISGVSKYISRDFNLSLDSAVKKLCKIPFKCKVRCRSVYSIANFIKSEILTSKIVSDDELIEMLPESYQKKLKESMNTFCRMGMTDYSQEDGYENLDKMYFDVPDFLI